MANSDTKTAALARSCDGACCSDAVGGSGALAILNLVVSLNFVDWHEEGVHLYLIPKGAIPR